MEVEIQDFYSPETADWLCCWVVASPMDGSLELHRQESSQYSLTMLPSAEEIVRWVERITINQDTKVIGLQQAIDHFVLQYSRHQTPLPMVKKNAKWPEC